MFRQLLLDFMFASNEKELQNAITNINIFKTNNKKNESFYLLGF